MWSEAQKNIAVANLTAYDVVIWGIPKGMPPALMAVVWADGVPVVLNWSKGLDRIWAFDQNLTPDVKPILESAKKPAEVVAAFEAKLQELAKKYPNRVGMTKIADIAQAQSASASEIVTKDGKRWPGMLLLYLTPSMKLHTVIWNVIIEAKEKYAKKTKDGVPYWPEANLNAYRAALKEMADHANKGLFNQPFLTAGNPVTIFNEELEKTKTDIAYSLRTEADVAAFLEKEKERRRDESFAAANKEAEKSKQLGDALKSLSR